MRSLYICSFVQASTDLDKDSFQQNQSRRSKYPRPKLTLILSTLQAATDQSTYHHDQLEIKPYSILITGGDRPRPGAYWRGSVACVGRPRQHVRDITLRERARGWTQLPSANIH